MNFQQVKSEALATVDAALAILNKFPDLNKLGDGLSLGISGNPFPFLLELFKTTKGYHWLVKIISYLLVYELPIIEIAVKGVILSNLRNLLTCSINPFITNELLRTGVAFNLDQVDLTDLLRHCPLDSIGVSDVDGAQTWSPNRKRNMGQYYYFGCEGMEVADDTKYSKDMNAVLWYMKNRATQREVWGRPDPSYNRLYEESAESDKHKKEDGIVTLEFHERTTTMRDAEGGAITIQSPMNNCLQVFIGNTQNKQSGLESANGENLKNDTQRLNDMVKKFKKILEGASNRIERDSASMKDLKKLIKTNETSKSNYESLETALDMWETYLTVNRKSTYYPSTVEDYNTIEKWIDDLQQFGSKLLSADDSYDVRPEIVDDVPYEMDASGTEKIFHDATWISAHLNAAQNKNRNALKNYYYGNNNIFPELKQNYYYHRTIIEFDFDYVSSVKLFDARVLTAQLIEQLLGSFSFGIQLTAKEYFIKNQVKEMVSRIVESDDIVVDDCFFAFSNDEYSRMLDKAEKQYAGYSVATDTTNPQKFDASSILALLDTKNADATQAGSMEVAIEGALTEMSGIRNIIGEPVTGTAVGFDTNIKAANILEQLLDNLAFIIVSAVLSPKVYLLILFNLKVLGQNTTFSLEGFINQYVQLIVSLLRMVRDKLIEFLVRKLQDILVEIAKQIAVKISVEQAKYYADLIKRCIKCFRFSSKYVDWNMDNVMHADIENSDVENETDRTCD